MDFTVEEMNLMCIYDVRSKRGLIRSMVKSLPFVEDDELKMLMQSLVERLDHMDDAAFSTIVFAAAFDDDESEE